MTSTASTGVPTPLPEGITDEFVRCLRIYLVDCGDDLPGHDVSLRSAVLTEHDAFIDVRSLIKDGAGMHAYFGLFGKGRCGVSEKSTPHRGNGSKHSAGVIKDGPAPI